MDTAAVGQEQQVSTLAQLRRINVLQEHLSSLPAVRHAFFASTCRASASRPEGKVAKAGDAVDLIPDSAVITVSLATQRTQSHFCSASLFS